MFQSVLKACFQKQIYIFGFITCLHVSEKALLLSCIVQSRNGDGEIRTHDPLLARQVLSQLSYTPTVLFR